MNEAIRRSLQNANRERRLVEEEERQLQLAMAASLGERAYHRYRAFGDEGAGPSTAPTQSVRTGGSNGAGPSRDRGGAVHGKRKRELSPEFLNALAKKHRKVMESGYVRNVSNFGEKLGQVSLRDIAYKQLNIPRMDEALNVPLVADPQGLCGRRGYLLRTDYGLVLQPYQVKAVCLILRPNIRGMFLNYGMGVGKTLTAVACADNLLRIDPTFSSVVVICPSGVRDNFERTFSLAPIYGRDVPVRLLTWHAFRGGITDGQIVALCLDSILIIDEVHNGRAQEGQMAAKAVLACRAARKVILMSGTPIVNYPSDIGVILNMIRGPNTVPTSREHFEGLFGIGGLDKNVDLLRRALDCVVLSHHRDPGDPSFPRRIDAPGVFYHMTPAQREAHAAQHPEDEHSEDEDDGDERVMTETDKYFTRMRQISNAVYLDPGGRPLSGDADAAALNDALEAKRFVAPKFRSAVRMFVRRGMPQTVFYTHWQRYGVDILVKLLQEAGAPFGVFAGARRGDEVRRFNAPMGDPEKYRAIILTDAGSEGLNLLDARHVHVMEPQFNRSRVEQAIARAIRKDSHVRLPPEERTVTVHEHFCVMPTSREDGDHVVPRVKGWLKDNSGDSIVRQIAETKRQRNDRFVRAVEYIAARNETKC